MSSEPEFRIRPVSEKTRPDLEERVESKYVHRGADIPSLRQALLRTCRPIRYAGKVSTVYSLSFDDPALSACHANLMGIGLRHKSRLRWYDDPTAAGGFYFETKWRRHRVTGKRRTRFDAEQTLDSVPLRRLHRALRNSLPESHRDHIMTDSEAVVLIRYSREHFAHQGSDARLTLDYDIQAVDLLGHRRLRNSLPRRLQEISLIECKTAPGEARSLHKVIEPLRSRPDRFSKYVMACQLMGYTRID